MSLVHVCFFWPFTWDCDYCQDLSIVPCPSEVSTMARALPGQLSPCSPLLTMLCSEQGQLGYTTDSYVRFPCGWDCADGCFVFFFQQLT